MTLRFRQTSITYTSLTARAPFPIRAPPRSPIGLSGHRLVCCTQNHDQIGNRARGERLAHLVSTDRLKIAAAVLFTSPFIPMLFQGEEWAASSPFQYFTGHPQPDLARAVSEGRKREFVEFGWDPAVIPDPQALATFARSKLDWTEPAREPHHQILKWYRELIVLRRRCPTLTNGHMHEVKVTFDEAAQWLVMLRQPIALAFNLSAQRQTIALPEGAADQLLMTSEQGIVKQTSSIELPAETVAILAPSLN
jgi:maltooligosyltrehalose trehalohydrolase